MKEHSHMNGHSKKQWALTKDMYVLLSKTKLLLIDGEHRGRVFCKVRVKHTSDEKYHWGWLMEGGLDPNIPGSTLGISKDKILCEAGARHGNKHAYVDDTVLGLM